jgi:hypothetical protein
MPLPPKDELKAWFLTWLDDEHPECESGVDLIVALFEALGEFLDRHAASDDEYQRTIGVCLHTLLEGDFWTYQNKLDILSACEGRLDVRITATN